MLSAIKEFAKKHDSDIVIVLLIIIQVVVMLCLATQRQYLNCDEIMTYGLANNPDHAFLEAYETEGKWVPSDYYTSYTLYQDKAGFDFVSTYLNQDRDVHPPLYYMFIHLFSKLFQRYNTDALPGALVNLVFLLLSDLLIVYIAGYFFENKWYRIIPLIIWGFSAGCFSNALLIRMYMVQTAEILLFLAFHILILKRDKKINLYDMLVFALIVAVGGLTHYYFYFFVGMFAFLACIYLIIKKKFALMLKYGISLVAGIGIALFAFPSTLSKHFLGYRTNSTVEALELSKISSLFREMADSISEQMGSFIVLLVIIALFVIISIIKKPTVFTGEDDGLKMVYLVIMTVVGVAFWILVIKGASTAFSVRYTYPVMAVFSFSYSYMVIVISKCVTGTKSAVIAILFTMLLPILSLIIHGVDWRYKDFDVAQLESVKDTDAIAFYDSDRNVWSNLYDAVIAMNEYDEIIFVPMSNYENYDYNELINSRKTLTEPISIITIPGFSENNYNNLDKAISKVTTDLGYSEAQYASGFVWEAYQLVK